MYVVTGGAGFIGSNVVAHLSDRGEDVVVCDWMKDDDRWRNLAKHEVLSIITPPQLRPWLDEHRGAITAVLHMGAISATTELDVEKLTEYNIRATLDLLQWCTATKTRLIYASSAATYGNGDAGFDDEFTPTALGRLKPLNAYGWSKHVVDRRIARLLARHEPLPPQYVGLKFFNVYGPNEYHKGAMQSIIVANYQKIMMRKPLRLFRSYRAEYPDGGQLRDFIYVKDCVSVIAWFLENSSISGLFNVGTGEARSWQELGHAMFAAVDRPPEIEYVDMPEHLKEKYQYFTEAKIDRLRALGYSQPFTSLKDGVNDYVRTYLACPDPYR